MSTDSTGAFDDVLDAHMQGESNKGITAARKVELRSYDAPLWVLDKVPEIDVPHRDYLADVEDRTPFPSSIEHDGTHVHLYQDVREDMDEDFGAFGDVGEDDDVIWTVASLTDDEVRLMVVGEWGKRRTVPIEDFVEDYEPITVETGQGTVPKLGY